MSDAATTPASASPVAENASTPPAPAGRGRSQRAMLTWVTNLLYTIVMLLTGFVVTPLLLKFLGADRIGASKAATDWFGYLMLADLGLGPALGVLMMKAQAKDDKREVAALARYALRLYFRLNIVLMPLAIILAWCLPYLINIPASLANELRFATMLGAVGLVFYPFGIFRAVLDTGQRSYLVICMLLIQSLLISTVGVLLAWRGLGLYSQTIAYIVGNGCFAIGVAILALRGLPRRDECPKPDVSLRKLWSIGWPLAVNTLGNRINLMTDSIVIGNMFTSAHVATFVFTQRLIMTGGGQVNGLVNATWAALAELRSRGEHALFQARFLELVRLVISLGFTLTGTIAAYNVHFVRLWVGEAHYGESKLSGDMLSIFTAVGVIIFGFVCLCAWFIDMQGDSRLRLKIGLLGSAINLGSSVLFAYFIGLPGVALGTVVGYLSTDAWNCPRIMCRHYGISPAALIRAVTRGVLYGLPWAVAIWFVAHGRSPVFFDHASKVWRWLGFGLELGIAGLAAVTYCWLVIFTQDERHLWLRRLRLKSRGD